MSSSKGLSRRRVITAGLAATAGATGLAAAGKFAAEHNLIPPDHGGVYGIGETLTYASHRLLTRNTLAREFRRDQISTAPFANGTPLQTEAYKRLEASGFAGWRLDVEGLVSGPTSLSVAQLREHPSSSQITHLACEEGWSYIAEWTGVPLSRVLGSVGSHPNARYVVYYSMEDGWWESIDMADALHPQTLITWGMNGADLPAAFGGPLRMRLPRQLGYKSLKYINRLVVTDNIKSFGKGLGSASPEAGYAWYAGI